MTDHTLARADEVLTELVELVETARTLPMSSSCVLPREKTLDLLDALREVLPPEMIEARKLVADRDRVVAEADEHAKRTVIEANDQAVSTRAEARTEADSLVQQARVAAHELLEAAREEQAQLVAASTIHQTAYTEAATLTAQTRIEVAQQRAAAEQYAGKLADDAHTYAESTLSELVATLTKLAGTAENGRVALSRTDPTGIEDGAASDPGDEAGVDPNPEGIGASDAETA